MLNKYSVLDEYFGYKSFREPQDKIIDSIMEGNDTIALLPTGFGKSIAFQVPALMLEGLTIVITPLIALMEDQVSKLKAKRINAAMLNSGMSFESMNEVFNNLNRIKLLYVSAERLENNYFLSKIENIKVEMIVIDEAHTILWGESFREAFIRINRFIKLFKKRPRILALTATSTELTTDKIKQYLELNNPNVIITNMDRKNICYRIIKPKNKQDFLLSYLKLNKDKKGIIYCLTRKKLEELSNILKKQGIKNTIYHGGLDQDIKLVNQELFKGNVIKLIICTNAFGMGIDIPDIRYVIDYEIPQSIEDMVQQLGRAGRDGKHSEGIVLFDFKDIGTVKYFIEQLRGVKPEVIVKQQEKKLNDLIDYCLSDKCRHQMICNYFGQKINKCQNNCDNCKKV